MKRRAAVVGFTPAFLRWAIWLDCPLRECDAHRFVDQAFRDLRAIREWSIAVEQQREYDEFCFQPRAEHQAPENVGGFHSLEVLSAFGGRDRVLKSCHACPANVHPTAPTVSKRVAGCYGFLPTIPVDLERMLAGDGMHTTSPDVPQEVDLPTRVQQAIERLELSDAVTHAFGKPGHSWHRLWTRGFLSGEMLDLVHQIFSAVVAESGHPVAGSVLEVYLTRWLRAIEVCRQEKLALHVELVPAGYSDGESWKWKAACPTCQYESEHPDQVAECPGCGRIGRTPPGRRLKVLGLRPYVLLQEMLGSRLETDLLPGYRSYRDGLPASGSDQGGAPDSRCSIGWRPVN